MEELKNKIGSFAVRVLLCQHSSIHTERAGTAEQQVATQEEGPGEETSLDVPPTVKAEMDEGTSPSPTCILNLPDSLLCEILRRVGSPRLPIFHPKVRFHHHRRHFGGHPTQHTLQCAFVCKHWHAIVPWSVQSLSLELPFALYRLERSLSPSRPEGGIKALGSRLSSLNSVTLHSFYQRGFDPHLAGLEHLARNLRTLKIQFQIYGPEVNSLVRILTQSQNLRSLVLHISLDGGPVPSDWLDAVCRLPFLQRLRLAYEGTENSAVFAKLDAMTALEELHLTCAGDIPPVSLSRIPGILRSLCCKGEGSRELAVAHLTALDTLTLSGSWTDLASLSALSHLSELTLKSGLPLSTLPVEIGSLSGLQILRLENCYRLQTLPAVALGGLRGLRVLCIESCTDFQGLPETVGDLPRLRTLRVDTCPALPESLSKLTSLESLHLDGLETIALPASIGKHQRLKSLVLNSTTLQRLPDSVGDLAVLENVSISVQSMEGLPESIGRLTCLKHCHLNGVQSLSESMGSWLSLQSLEIVNCSAVLLIPDSFCRLTRLESLKILKCQQLQGLPEGVSEMSTLTTLSVQRCRALRALPDGVGRLRNLETLSFQGCRNLLKLPASISELHRLQHLDLDGCHSLKELPEGVQDLPRLERLDCPNSISRSNIPWDILVVWGSVAADEDI